MTGPEYGETWTYESVIAAVPGIDLTPGAAIAVQLVLFEAALVGLVWYYDLRTAAVVGTTAVIVAALGSAAMLRIGNTVRRPETPEPYRHLLFGSSVEVVLSVFVFAAVVTHLVSGRSTDPLVEGLFGSDPHTPVVYLALLVLWDLCYRIATSWWASIVGLWRSIRYRFDAETAALLRRADRETAVFGLLQLPLLAFLTEQPLLFAALATHAAAVCVVSGASIALLWYRDDGAIRVG